MRQFVIPDLDGHGFTRIHDSEDFEYVNPEEFYRESEIEWLISEQKDILYHRNPIFASFISEQFYYRNAKKTWDEMLAKYMSVEIPEYLFDLLRATTKKEQIRLLREQRLNAELWFAFIIASWKTYNYTLSSYTYHGLPAGTDESLLPSLIVDEKEFRVAGKTKLSIGQLKNVIAHRKVIVARVLDNGENWHCFFCTFKSMRGEESWKLGTPHWHYISDKWGVPRSEVISAIKSGKYPATNVHIEFEELESNLPNDQGGELNVGGKRLSPREK